MKKRGSKSVAKTKTCRECGTVIKGARRVFCSDECYETHIQEVLFPRFERSGLEKLTELRAEGNDPSHGGLVGKKRGRTNADWAKKRIKWETHHGDGEEERKRFVEEIQPMLEGISLSKIMEATGLSKRYASLIRKGLHVPHPLHNEALELLIEPTD